MGLYQLYVEAHGSIDRGETVVKPIEILGHL